METQLNFFSRDPDANPLLDLGLRSDLPRTAMYVLGLIALVALAYTAYTDTFRAKRLPGHILQGFLAGSVVLVPFLYETPWVVYLIGGLTALITGLFVYMRGMGRGDAELYTALALLFGPAGIAIFFLSIAGAALAGVAMVAKHRARGIPVPMVPFIYLACLAVLWALHVPGWLLLTGLAMFLVAAVIGLMERIIAPAVRLEDMAAPVLSGDADVLQLRRDTHPVLWTGTDATPLPRPRRLTSIALAALSSRALPRHVERQLHGHGAVTWRPNPDGSLLTIVQILDGYCIFDGERPSSRQCLERMVDVLAAPRNDG